MATLQRPGTPQTIRFALAAGLFIAGVSAWMLGWLQATQGQHVEPSVAALAAVGLVAAFLGLGLTAGSSASTLPARIGATIGLVTALLLFAEFPRPLFFGLFAAMVALSTAVLLLMSARPVIAFYLLLIQAAAGVYLAWGVIHLATAFPIAEAARVPLAFWAILAAASIVTAWNGRALRKSVAPRAGHAASGWP